ncbi:hypothetical protein G6F70_008263 [Rhizopus microsporus]|nr:hypothetical protein G6F71_006036 [Rhizopus microsporus]KAG1195403.1 hypothetical protein G6F70_008263 [Rhizopus microsporus]KAG1208137.1 hypothetical protein G6F69_007476 [Rhizopus microsporus]KAG1229203.1 hypothetical protein G6F67_007317 [Rhizopus microsporus]KAG1259855.1 hypothetical protein G6F68_007844 [Rhizopus microsporus]
MRVKLVVPSLRLKCWFAAHEEKTIYQLQKSILKELSLEAEASEIISFMKEIHFAKYKKDEPATKKQKKSTEKDKKPSEKDKKSTEKDKKPSEKDKKKASTVTNKEENKKLLKTVEKLKNNSKKLDEKLKSLKKLLADNVNELMKNKQEEKNKIKKASCPFEGLKRTKSRNARRRRLKKLYREAAALNHKNSVAVDTTDQGVQEQLLHHEPSISMSSSTEQQDIPPPLHLIKQNKNKKKEHLKRSEQTVHIHFEEELPEELPSRPTAEMYDELDAELATENTQQNNDPKNKYGRAFVTYSEAAPEQTRKRNQKYQRSQKTYAVQEVAPIFYAENPIEESVPEQILENQEIENTVENNENELHINEPTATNRSINYEEYPKLDFESNLPSVGDHLAIKTLELTANYTPEISDWKEATLKELCISDKSLVVELLQGFTKASTKGGKFELKNKRHEDENDEEEEEEEEDRMITLMWSDIFDIRKLVF